MSTIKPDKEGGKKENESTTKHVVHSKTLPDPGISSADHSYSTYSMLLLPIAMNNNPFLFFFLSLEHE